MSVVIAHRPLSHTDDCSMPFTYRLRGIFRREKPRSKPIRPGPLESSTQSSTAEDVKESQATPCEEIPISPARFSIRSECYDLRRFSTQRLLFYADGQLAVSKRDCNISDLNIQPEACHKVLSIPELVELILLQLEDTYRLAATTTKNDRPELRKTNERSGPLFACLQVNSIFSQAAKRVISKRVALHDYDEVVAYTQSNACKDNLCRDLLLHRVKTCEQEQFEQIGQFRLRSLELYVCPKLVPTAAMLSSGSLLKIALPGCALIDDNMMLLIAQMCKKLQILDLRACELVSDQGILAIADSCRELNYLNVGRIKRSEAITDRSIVAICKQTSIETLGLAGCMISDTSVIAVAQHRAAQIERLSMNQCRMISDYAICELLRSTPRLQVLEVVGCDKLQDAKTMCFFKLSTGALVETSDKLAAQIQLCEREVKHELDILKLRASSVKAALRRVTA